MKVCSLKKEDKNNLMTKIIGIMRMSDISRFMFYQFCHFKDDGFYWKKLVIELAII